jgi:hypothetical protein
MTQQTTTTQGGATGYSRRGDAAQAAAAAAAAAGEKWHQSSACSAASPSSLLGGFVCDENRSVEAVACTTWRAVRWRGRRETRQMLQAMLTLWLLPQNSSW